MKKVKNNLKAFWLGVKDGWEQPYELTSSWNVDHLYVKGNDPWDWQDRGINFGQRLRSPLRYQRFD